MTRTWAVGVLGCALVGALLMGCGEDSDDGGNEPTEPAASAEEAALAGHTFVADTVTGHELVDRTTLTVAFENHSMAISAGCNTLFGAYVDDDQLRWEAEPASTFIQCDPPLAEQDAWLTTLFTDGLTIEENTGTVLELASGDIRIELSQSDTDEPTSSSDYAAVLNGPTSAQTPETVQLTLSNLGSSRDSYRITVLPPESGAVAPRHVVIEPGRSAKVDVRAKTTPVVVMVESAGAGGYVDGFTIR